jgi:phage host-nuclease inhibitor protein Gam
MAKKAKAEKTPEQLLAVPVPRSDFECDEYIYNVGELQRQLERLQLAMNDEVEAAKARHAAAALPLATRLNARLAAIEAYCEANRAALTENGRVKFHRFDSGEVKWREAPPKVKLRNVETILAWLLEQQGKFRKFVRVKHEVDKETILGDPELAKDIPGVTITSAGEAFYVTPNETRLEALA